MLIYRMDGDVNRVDLNGRAATLAELQGFVGGFIEIVPGSREFGGVAYCNEDGRLVGLAVNSRASVRFNQTLVGVVVELDANEFAATERDPDDPPVKPEGVIPGGNKGK